ncbi:glycosyltransferase family 4 protein [Natrinema sp. HArc-T2]|uniref:glycosyltransferase family 4 protein n=1 Tax=Natrinema sp. HArc-T2 TaxID=3242701 RepID=UPI00359D7B07
MSTRHPDVLIVGTYGGGGVHQYVEEQHRRLDDRLSVSSYDMRMPPSGSGVFWVMRAVLMGIWAAVKFPFRSRPDVVHVHTSYRFSFYRSSLYVLCARYIWRRPVVLHIHGSSFDDFVATDSSAVAKLQSLVFDASDRIIVLSEYWKDVVATRADEDSITVLPNAVDPDNYQPTFDHDVPHLVFISNLIERKGVSELIAAIDELNRTTEIEFRVSIAGKGPLADQVVDFADQYDDVTYHGYVSEAKKQSLLENGSIYVLPTYAEGLPIAMLEGMAGGNAIVSTTVGSIPEVIGEDNGVLVPPGDVDELREGLRELLMSPDRVDRMGRVNYETIQEEYSWEEVTEDLLRIYDTNRSHSAGSAATA